MSVSLVGSPQTLTPGYNESVWYFDSSNKNLPGFRYYIQILNSSSVVIGTYRYAPSITVGYAIVNLSRILKNFLSADDNTGTTIQSVPNSWFGYTIKVYEEYNTAFTYGNFVNPYFPVGDLTALYSAGTVHPFAVGDQINISQTDGGVLNASLQGIHTVIAPTVVGSHYVYIDVSNASLAAGTMGGSVIYADNRKTVSTVQYTSSSHYVFNGAVPFEDFITWNDVDYKMIGASTATKFLTSMPTWGNDGPFHIYETQDIRLNFANYFTTGNKIHFKNDSGDEFLITTGVNTTSQAIMSVQVGPLTTMSSCTIGSAPLVKPTTNYYTFWVENSGGTQISETRSFWIDRRCRIQQDEIVFMDRMGSLVSYAFPLRGDVVNNNTKSTYKKLAGGLSSDVVGTAYNYASTAKGEQIYNVNYSSSMTMNTNWMTDDESLYFQELISSPITYLKTDNNTGTYINCIVTTSSMAEQRSIDKRLIQYTINVRYSNPTNINF